MEKARMLCDSIKRREKLKRRIVRHQIAIFEQQCRIIHGRVPGETQDTEMQESIGKLKVLEFIYLKKFKNGHICFIK